MNLLEAAALFTEMAIGFDKAKAEALDHAGAIVQEEAKRVIGTYDYGWPALAPSTLDKKGADTPLLEEGGLRDSIQRKVEGSSAYVGSDEDKAVWAELGTSRGEPPRSFLASAAQAKEAEVAHSIGTDIVSQLIKR